MKAYTLQVESIVITSTDIESATSSKVLDLVLDAITDNPESTTVRVIPMVPGQQVTTQATAVVKPEPKTKLKRVIPPSTDLKTQFGVKDGDPLCGLLDKVAERQKKMEKRKKAEAVSKDPIVSANGSMVMPCKRGPEFRRFYDTETNKSFSTKRKWRFRKVTEELEFKYTSHEYVNYAASRIMGTYGTPKEGKHVYLTPAEAKRVRDHHAKYRKPKADKNPTQPAE